MSTLPAAGIGRAGWLGYLGRAPIAADGSARLWNAAAPSSRRTVSAFVTLCFVAKLFAGLLLLAATPSGDTTWIPICTADGLKWVELDAAGKPVADAPVPGKAAADRPCPFCLAWAGGVPFLVPPSPRLRVPRFRRAPLPQPWGRVAPALRLAARPPPSRAPPFVSH